MSYFTTSKARHSGKKVIDICNGLYVIIKKKEEEKSLISKHGWKFNV